MRMLESLKIWPLLGGYRGSPAVNKEKLIEVLIRLSYLVVDYPEIVELDINPLLVGSEGAIALDARFVFDRKKSEEIPKVLFSSGFTALPGRICSSAQA